MELVAEEELVMHIVAEAAVQVQRLGLVELRLGQVLGCAHSILDSSEMRCQRHHLELIRQLKEVG